MHPHAISFSGTRFSGAVLFWAQPICPLFGPVFLQLEKLTGGPSRLHDDNITTMKPVAKFLRSLMVLIGVNVRWYFQASLHAVNSEKQSSLTMIQGKKHHRSRWFCFSQISPSKANKLTEIQFNQALQISRKKTHLLLPWMNLRGPPHHHCYTRVALFTSHWWFTRQGFGTSEASSQPIKESLTPFFSLNNDGIFKITKCPSRCFMCNMAFRWWSCPKVRLAHYCASLPGVGALQLTPIWQTVATKLLLPQPAFSVKLLLWHKALTDQWSLELTWKNIKISCTRAIGNDLLLNIFNIIW